MPRIDLDDDRPILGQVPAFEGIVEDLQKLVRGGRHTASDVVRLIEQDAQLSLEVLALCNSPFFGSVTPVVSLPQAMATLGGRKVETIAKIAAILHAIWPTTDDARATEEAAVIWEHSKRVARGALRVAIEYRGRRDGGICFVRELDDLFLYGLLHDMGRVLFLGIDPDASHEAAEEARVTGNRACDIERHWFGMSHAEVATAICREWGMPARLTRAVRLHHRPADANDEFLDHLHLGDALTHLASPGTKRVDRQPHPDVLARRGFTLEDLTRLAADL